MTKKIRYKEHMYKSYADLIRAYNIGELDRNKHVLMMDNDDAFLYVYNSSDKDEDAICVFRGNGEYDIVELANDAGIPCEKV